MAEIDIGRSIFEYGQTYVALSRIQSLDGLYLSDFEPGKIKANPKVIEFYNTIQEIDDSELVSSSTSENIFQQYKYSEAASNTFTATSTSKSTKVIKI
jgi:ATP-dependent DNA helicase PIF1